MIKYKYKCLVRAINIETGSALLRVKDNDSFDSLLNAVIKDSTLREAKNVYTEALNNQKEIEVTAKQSLINLKDGKIKKLFVTDAKFLTE